MSFYDFSKETPSRVIALTRSDGSHDQAPRDGLIYARVPRDSHASRMWRGTVGTFIAKHSGLDVSGGKAWHIQDWPQGYSLWRRNRDSTAVKHREDFYLYGFRKRFASPREFAFHALWLYQGGPDGKACVCTVCTGRNQGEINELELGEPRGGQKATVKPKPQPSSSVTSSKKEPMPLRSSTRNSPHVYQAMRPSSTLATPKDQSPSQCVARERDYDLRSGKGYRIGEIVWVSIPPITPPSSSDTLDDTVISFWPALVQEQRMKPSVRPAETPGQSWDVVQTTYYLILCLGVMQLQVISEDQLLPYQGHKASPRLEEILRTAPAPSKLSEDCHELESFKPFPEGLVNHQSSTDLEIAVLEQSFHGSSLVARSFQNALCPLSLALRTARRIVTYWSPSHKWRYQAQAVSFETRWQGLFYGPERIWMDDLVRLACTRSDMDTANRATLANPSPGAEERGLLVAIRSITLDDNGLGAGASMVFSGLLFELAPEAWKEPEGDEEHAHASNSKPTHHFLSTPALAEHYPMPPPPPGFRFRLISPPGYEIYLPIQFIAGRYYGPDVLKSEAMKTARGQEPARALGLDLGGEPSSREQHMLALASLGPGTTNPIQCKKWKEGREEMIREADEKARSSFYSRWEAAKHDDMFTDTRAYIV